VGASFRPDDEHNGDDGVVTVRQDVSTSEIVSLRSFVGPDWGRVFQ
jgi:hypothetical protein